MGAAVVLPLRVAVPIDGAFSHMAVVGCRLKRRAAQRHVNAGCSLVEGETTEEFNLMHSGIQSPLKYLLVWINCHQRLN